jgi:hypothetical protein
MITTNSEDTRSYIKCSNCGAYVYECCIDAMVDKFGLVRPNTDKSRIYGEDAVRYCNECTLAEIYVQKNVVAVAVCDVREVFRTHNISKEIQDIVVERLRLLYE